MKISSFLLIFLLFSCTTQKIDSSKNILNEYQILKTKIISEVEEQLLQLPEKSIIFFDVDDTLITPSSLLFRASSPYKSMIDEIKKNKKDYPNFKNILSDWRLKRKSILVSTEWPRIIKNLKMSYPVYALTQMNSGSFGRIHSMEKWRYDELHRMGIVFLNDYDQRNSFVVIPNFPSYLSSTFFQGIFMTGDFGKDRVIHELLKNKKFSKIVMIDDREDHLIAIEKECKKNSVSFLGIHFRGIDLIPGTPNKKIAEYQKNNLIQNAKWLEDDEAIKKINTDL